MRLFRRIARIELVLGACLFLAGVWMDVVAASQSTEPARRLHFATSMALVFTGSQFMVVGYVLTKRPRRSTMWLHVIPAAVIALTLWLTFRPR